MEAGVAPLLPAPRHPQLPAELSGAHTFLFSPLLLPCIQLEGQARKAKEEGSPGKTNTVHLGPAGLEKNKLEPRVGQAGPQLPGIPRPQNHPAPRKPSPDLEPEPSGPRWTRRRVGGGGQRGAGGNTYLLGHQAGDAHGPSHPAFLGPGLQGPCPARLPQRGRHGGLGSPQPACPGAPRAHASTSPAPQRLAAWLPGQPLAWRPGSPGLGLRAGVTLAGSVASSPPGQGGPWFLPQPRCGPHGRELRSARCQPSSRRPALSEPPAPPAGPSSSRVPTPTPPAGRRPPPPRPPPGAPAAAAPAARAPPRPPAARPVTAD